MFLTNKMDIFKFPLYYISFNQNRDLEKKCKDLGFTNVNHFKAIDGRKFETEKLLKDKKITYRAYSDLLQGRHEHSGIPGLGSIGCSMSHYNLWKKCVDNNFPYIIVLEDDVSLPNKISRYVLKKISEPLYKPNGLFVSATIKRSSKIPEFQGSQFCILSNGACKELIKNIYPIDMQVDYYMSLTSKKANLSLEGYKFAGQKIHKSSIQDFCVKCSLPKGYLFYISSLVVSIIFFSFLFISWRKCNSKFAKCTISLQACEKKK